MTQRFLCILFSAVFSLQSFFIDLPLAYAASPLSLPATNQMLALSEPLHPVMLQGLRYDPQEPFKFEFILQQGDHPLPLGQLRDQGMDLVRYFMAAMAMPADDLWVNLSPYEKNRIIPTGLEVTRLGSDMLVQDYILKQLSSSLTFPDSKPGGAFWQKIYSETQARFGTTNVPVSTFNKVWIVPDYAEVFIKDNTVIVTDSHLKVMMEQDYLSLKNHVNVVGGAPTIASDVMRQVIIPILEKEVNTGTHFVALRQMYHAVVLAEWYKRNLKESLFNQYYADRHKVAGIDEVDEKAKEAIYKRYLSAYKKGVYNFIREDSIPGTNEIVPRKYFSGGMSLNVKGKIIERRDFAQLSLQGKENIEGRNAYLMDVGALPAGNFAMLGADGAMTTPNPPETAQEFIKSKNTLFLDEMRGRWSSKEGDPQDVKQLIEELKYKNESVWVRWKELDTPFGPQRVLMVRVRHHGKVTRGGVRVQYAWQGDDIKKLFQMLKLYSPTQAEERTLDTRVGVQIAMALGIGMTFKNEAEELDIGGAKGLIYFPQANNLDKTQLEVLKNIAFYWYAYELTKDKKIGPDIDGLAPDVNSGSQQMDIATEGHLAALVEQGEDAFEWKNGYMDLLKGDDLKGFVPPPKGSYKELFTILSRIKKIKDKYPQQYFLTPLKDAYDLYGKAHPGLPMPADATFTGKSIDKWGIEGREQATGDGSSEVAVNFYDLLGQDHVGKTAAIQGMGNVGIYTALTAVKKGLILKDFGNIGVTLHNENGFSYSWLEDLMKLIKTYPERTLLLDIIKDHEDFFKGVEIQSEEKVLEADVDILFPAATQNVITMANCGKIRAKIIAEAANDPVTSEAERELYKRGILIIPDSLVNAGGVTVSKLEQMQALLGRKFSLEYVQARMYETLKKALKKYYDLWVEQNKGVAVEQQVTLRDIVKQEVIKSLARKQMIAWIDRNNGEINEIIKNEYHVVISEKAFEGRVKELGLLDYLYQVKVEEFDKMRIKIMDILIKDGIVEGIDINSLKKWLYTALPDYDWRTQRSKFKYTLAVARTVLRIISGKGEYLSSAVFRLSSMGFNIPRARDLRLKALNRLYVPEHPETTHRVNSYMTYRLIKLDDADDSVPAEKRYALDPRDPAMAAANGGIDFNTSHMLINQEGEANFKSQAKVYNSLQWQQVKGFVPVFLRISPVNISLYMGIKG